LVVGRFRKSVAASMPHRAVKAIAGKRSQVVPGSLRDTRFVGRTLYAGRCAPAAVTVFDAMRKTRHFSPSRGAHLAEAASALLPRFRRRNLRQPSQAGVKADKIVMRSVSQSKHRIDSRDSAGVSAVPAQGGEELGRLAARRPHCLARQPLGLKSLSATCGTTAGAAEVEGRSAGARRACQTTNRFTNSQASYMLR